VVNQSINENILSNGGLILYRVLNSNLMILIY